ncbi:CheA signal transduction histidine kinase [Flammeovirgaceae bacterium 311]|nr:CheA signal transduction histidine kinase [Flammeovirgaceae bacterium 311]
MIEHLKQKYLEEAQDLLLELEKTLLLLEENPADAEGVEVAFRVMHTLKGSSGMFGYQQVSELVHLLENGYDTIRTNQQAVPLSLLALSLEAVDHIRLLLTESASENKGIQSTHRLLLKQAAELLYEMPVTPEMTVAAISSSRSMNTWAIYFAPQKEMLRNGSNPLYILEELAGLGSLRSFACTGKLPSFNQLDPQDCYLSWMLLLATEAPEGEIREAFLFVEELCELQIIQLGKGDQLQALDAAQSAEVAGKVALKLDAGLFNAYASELAAVITEHNKIPPANKAQKSPVQPPASVKEKSVSSIRVASDKLDDLMNLVSELVANQARLSLVAELNNTLPELAAVAEEIEKITRRLRDKTFDICLIPLGSLLTRFKRLVRDLSIELNKNIVFDAEGLETELDKNVIEQLSDCLIHVFRNSIDHGIEDEALRIQKGKNPQGHILLKAYNSGTNVVLEVQDDGAGIDAAKVRAKAFQKGLIREDQLLTEAEIFELLFAPGFSTASQVTEVSGRGVGMDVVRKKITELRGNVQLTSVKDKGTTIIISLPLSISIIDGLLVRIADTDFILPLTYVENSYAVTALDILNARNNQLILNGEPLVFFNLAETFESANSSSCFAVVTQVGRQRVALLVEEIVGEYQAVLKPLGSFCQRQDFISGASLMGDGTVALVLDPHKLLQEITKKITVDV